jgi:hypothetical protein
MAICKKIKKINKYCREPISNIRGYDEAIKSDVRYDCHHINELTFTVAQLKKMNMYYHRPASELLFLTHSEHMKMHRDRSMPSCVQGEEHPAYHKYGKDSKRYRETVSIQGEYVRAKKAFRRGTISEEEFQIARNKWAEYQTQHIRPKHRAKLKG